jgi:hypothetical protein
VRVVGENQWMTSGITTSVATKPQPIPVILRSPQAFDLLSYTAPEVIWVCHLGIFHIPVDSFSNPPGGGSKAQ